MTKELKNTTALTNDELENVTGGSTNNAATEMKYCDGCSATTPHNREDNIFTCTKCGKKSGSSRVTVA